MQLGMVGLGRMGGNMVRRLLRGGHACVVYDASAEAVRGLGAEGAAPAASLRRARGEARAAAGDLADGAGGAWSTRRLAALRAAARARRRRRSTAATPTGPTTISARRGPARATASTIVDVGTSGGVFGLERGYCLMIGGEARGGARASSRSSRRSRPAWTRRRARPAATGAGPRRRARLPALRPAGRRALREDGPQRHRVRADGGLRRRAERAAPRGRRPRRARGRRRDDAARAPGALPVPLRPRARSPSCGGAAA